MGDAPPCRFITRSLPSPLVESYMSSGPKPILRHYCGGSQWAFLDGSMIFTYCCCLRLVLGRARSAPVRGAACVRAGAEVGAGTAMLRTR